MSVRAAARRHRVGAVNGPRAIIATSRWQPRPEDESAVTTTLFLRLLPSGGIAFLMPTHNPICSREGQLGYRSLGALAVWGCG